jgi:hypothetical protein
MKYCKECTKYAVYNVVGMRHKRVGDTLLSILEGHVELPNALVAVHYMYYDGWKNEADIKWELLSPFEAEGA